NTGRISRSGVEWILKDEVPDAALRCSAAPGKRVRSPRDPSLLFRLGQANTVEKSGDDGRTWTIEWSLPLDRARVVERQVCSLRSNCKTDFSDIEFLPDGSGSLVVALDLPIVAVRSPDGAWSLVGGPENAAARV